MAGDVPSEEQRSVSEIVFSSSSRTSEIRSSNLLKHEISILDALLSSMSSFTSDSSGYNQQKDQRGVKSILPPSFIFTCETPKNSLQKIFRSSSSDKSSSVLSSTVSKAFDSQLQGKEDICKSDISSRTSKARNCRPKKHIAVIVTSSDSESEFDGKSSINVNDCNEACSGDAPETRNCATGDEVKIKTTHYTVIPDLDEYGDCADYSSKINFEMTKFPRQLDYDKWSKKKGKEARRKKREEQLKAKSVSESLLMGEESAKHNAWVNWMCKKKNDELQKKMHENCTRRTEETEKFKKQMIAKQKFEEWVKKKKIETKTNQQENKAEGTKKLSKHQKKWDEWYAQKKDENIPKSFTHISYPKPAWVNPVPWSHPDPSEFLSSCADLDD